MKKLLVVLLVLGLAAPAMAQTNFQFYGSLRTHLGYYHTSENYDDRLPSAVFEGPAQDGTIGGAGYVNDEGTLLSMSGQSRLGVRGFVSDKLFGVVEFGFTETTRTGKSSAPYTRLAFGQWNFGAGSLIFGKHYTPGTYLMYSNMIGDIGDQGEAVMLVGGIPYVGRVPQIRLTVAGFELALIEQNTPSPVGATSGYNVMNANLAAAGYGDIDRTLPRIEAAYELKTPMITIRPAVGYQTYKAQSRALNNDITVDSYLAALGLRLNFGPAYINMVGSWQQNAGNYGNSNFVAPIARSRTLAGNAESLQGVFVVGFNFSPTLAVEAGYSYTENKVDSDRNVEQKQNGSLYYAQARIGIAKGFTLTPEVGQLASGDIKTAGLDELAQGRMTYGLVSLKIDF